MIIEEKKQLAAVKNSRTVYQRLEEDWRKVEEEELKGREEMKRLLKDRKKTDFESIKLHETKYNEMMN